MKGKDRSMKNRIKRVLALFMTLCMLLMFYPFSVNAKEDPGKDGGEVATGTDAKSAEEVDGVKVVEEGEDKDKLDSTEEREDKDKLKSTDEREKTKRVEKADENNKNRWRYKRPALAAVVRTDTGDMKHVGNTGLIEYCGYGTNLFYVGTGGTVWNCYCIEPDKAYPRQGHEIIKTTEITDPTMRKICYYTYNAPGYKEAYDKNAGKLKNAYVSAMDYTDLSYKGEALYAIGHLMMSYAADNTGVYENNWSYTLSDGYISATKELVNAIKSSDLPNPTSEFKLYLIYLDDDSDQAMVYWTYNPQYYGGINLIKKYNNDCAKNNKNYDLKATYTVYSDGACSKAVKSVTTSVNGNAVVDGLKAGRYYIKETKASKNCKLDSKVYQADVVGSHLANEKAEPSRYPTVVSTEEIIYDPTNLLIYKMDKLTGESVTEGKADLSGAVFEVKFYGIDNTRDYTEEELIKYKPDRTWRLKTVNLAGYYTAFLGEECFVSGDPFYRINGSKPILPLGVLSIEEIKAPKGYELDNSCFYIGNDEFKQKKLIVRNDQRGLLWKSEKSYKEEIKVQESPIRGDFSFTKCDEDGNPMDKVRFTIKCNDTGESHEILTDENGSFSSKDSLLWFEMDNAGKKIKKDEAYGALYTGTYTLTEESCEANKGKQLEDPIVFTVEEKKNYIIKDQNVKEDKIVNVSSALMKTRAKTAQVKGNVLAAKKDQEIIDQIYYKNLKAGECYTVSGRLMTVDEEGNVSELKDKDGKLIQSKVSFTTDPEYESSKYEKDGEVTVKFKGIDASNLSGKRVVIFEKLYLGDEIPEDDSLARQYDDSQTEEKAGRVTFPICHEDINDIDQTLYCPDIKTKASDLFTESQQSRVSDKEEVRDTIELTGLKAGNDYKLIAELVFSDGEEAGKKVLDENGKEISCEIEFTANESHETKEVSVYVDSSILQGRRIVFTESLFYKGVDVKLHLDLNDKDQSLYVPKIGTKALGLNSQTKQLELGKTKVCDTVSLEGLIEGEEYLLHGYLFDKTLNTELKNEDKLIECELKFIAGDKSEQEMIFTFDSSLYEGHEIVCFEELIYKDKIICEHKNIDCIEQTVYIPACSTNAYEMETEGKVVLADENVKIYDRVEYKNLLIGQEYKIVGYPVIKGKGCELFDKDKNKIQSEIVFTVEDKEGEILVPFEIDTRGLEGESLVFYEYIYLNDTEIARHEDIDSKEQTIQIPYISTYASDKKDGDKEIEGYKAQACDRVFFKNLEDGQEYLIEGVLMSYDSDGSNRTINNEIIVRGQTFFVAKAGEGFENVDFSIEQEESSAAKNLIIYEELYEVKRDTKGEISNKKLIAYHKDINSKEQSLRTVPPESPKTGDDFFIYSGLAIFVSGSFGTYFFYRKKRKDDEG